MTRVLVIGAGPAGLAAAAAALARGAEVRLVDAADQVGGQYWRHAPPERALGGSEAPQHGWGTFERLRDSVLGDARCEVITSASVWAIEPVGDGRQGVHVLVGAPDGSDRESRALDQDAIVLATGAHDRTLPFPGWELPGVFSAGAAQALAKGDHVAIGDRVVVGGAGPFLLPVAQSLRAVGSTVVGVYEAARAGRVARGWLSRPQGLLGASKKGPELAGYITGQLLHRVPYRLGTAIVRADGGDRVESVTIASVDDEWTPIAGTERTITVDAVCVGHGFTPRLELAIAAGCALDPARFVLVDDAQASTVPTVYAAGELTGIGGSDLALAEGEIAGHCAAGGSHGDPELRSALRRRRVYRSFADRIDRAHGIRSGWTSWLTDDTVLCRCEEVTVGRFTFACEATSGADLRALKLLTRVGVGLCQGRVCGRTVEELLAVHSSEPDGLDPAITDRRPIAMPLRLGELARGAPGQRDAPDPNHPDPTHPIRPTQRLPERNEENDGYST